MRISNRVFSLTLAAAANLNLNAEEKRVYGQLFRQADHDGAGIVTGETAVKFFEKTRLDSRVLGEVRHPSHVPPPLLTTTRSGRSLTRRTAAS